ncbi:hypothetical protein PSTG_04559 [Puccinia striiformis f. sp. tritici PST-78]|uniref:HAT C-terminal dimerisation domain-containing protein n=1 Tax=Puccinia striiformis f. sp. tritici PST-78 TaxID=1165861 RepID=A0A0L0VSW0_9BASI|nr:hypothetical protein PSTG_04559 [Puccinia striiformis f. sp. tritici PST-78]
MPLNFVQLKGSHTGKYLARMVQYIVETFGLQNRICGIVSDKASNNAIMVTKLAKLRQSFDHLDHQKKQSPTVGELGCKQAGFGLENSAHTRPDSHLGLGRNLKKTVQARPGFVEISGRVGCGSKWPARKLERQEVSLSGQPVSNSSCPYPPRRPPPVRAGWVRFPKRQSKPALRPARARVPGRPTRHVCILIGEGVQSDDKEEEGELVDLFNTEDKDNSNSEEEDEADGPKHKEGELAEGNELSSDDIQDLEENDNKDAYTSASCCQTLAKAILHPSFKLAKWPESWIDEAINLTRDMYSTWHKPKQPTCAMDEAAKRPPRVRLGAAAVARAAGATADPIEIWLSGGLVWDKGAPVNGLKWWAKQKRGGNTPNGLLQMALDVMCCPATTVDVERTFNFG